MIYCNIVVEFKVNCLTGEPRPMGGMPSAGVFLRDLSPYFRKFRENHVKLQTVKSASATGDENLTLSVNQFLELRTAQPLLGPRKDSLTSIPYPGFEPRTFGVADGFPNHYTAWSALL